jgi:lysophospholipase L1-like esterase
VIDKPVFLLALVLWNTALIAIWMHPGSVRQTLSPEKIVHENGFAYVILFRPPLWWHLFLGIKSDRPGATAVSHLRLFEDGKEIGPAHSNHADIRGAGEGRYSHWGNHLYLSASDNSDPSRTGRVYEIRFSASPSAGIVIPGFILLGVGLGRKKTTWKILCLLGFIGLGVASFVVPFELLLRSDYSKLHLLGVYGTMPERLRRTLNSQGYRDDEHAPGKVHDRLRILILGDSITLGDSLADDEIYPRRLGARLGSKVEIIAMARDGWSTADQLAAFKREGLSYAPDMVVVAIVTNDPEPPSTEPSGVQPEWIMFRRLPLNSDFFRFLDYNINRLGDIFGWRYTYSEWERDLFDPDKHYFSEWQKTVRVLAGVLKDRGIAAYAFIMINPINPSSPEQIRKYSILADTFADAGFATVNLYADFVRQFGESGGRRLWAIPNDPHPGPAVNRFFAREMAKVLEPRLKSMLSERRLQP